MAAVVSPPTPSAIRPAAVRYLKLGQGGHAAAECLRAGEIGLGFDTVPHSICTAGDWDQVTKFFLTAGKARHVASNHQREIRDFYEQGPETLWVTFTEGKLWWAFAETGVTWNDQLKGRLPRRRKTTAPWRSSDIQGNPLNIRDLSTRLTSVTRYQGTLCSIDEEDYLLRKINALPEPLVAESEQLRAALHDLACRLIATLHWRDFEILVDLIFTASGWRRVGILGETEADLDLLVEQIATGERAFVQVKSRASPSTLEDYVKRFRAQPGTTRMFFVCHTPSAALMKIPAPENVDLWFGPALANKVVRAGLFEWLVERVR